MYKMNHFAIHLKLTQHCKSTTIKLRYKKINKGLLYSRENYFQYPLINHHGKEYEKERISMHMDN